MERKRVLQVNIDNDGGNGAFALVRYLYTFLKDDYVFDYFTMGHFVNDLVYEDICEDGGKCYSADLRRNKLLGHIILPFKFYQCLKNNKYKIVHIHSEVAYKHFLYALAAKVAGVEKIVIHSHSNDIDGNYKGVKLLFHYILRGFVNVLGNDYLACSMPAAEWMFTKKTICSNNFRLLHNGINPSKYKYSISTRELIRETYGLQDKVVLGHVGALKKVKNQERLLEILHDINDKKYVLMLIGDGEDKEYLLKKVKYLNIEQQVLFLGNRTDVSELLQAMDIFIFPSLFEGIPMALIEAQTIGLPIVASDRINKEIRINDNISFVSLDNSNIEWCEEINRLIHFHLKESGFLKVDKSEYNIKTSADILRMIYSYD